MYSAKWKWEGVIDLTRDAGRGEVVLMWAMRAHMDRGDDIEKNFRAVMHTASWVWTYLFTQEPGDIDN